MAEQKGRVFFSKLRVSPGPFVLVNLLWHRTGAMGFTGNLE
jgi:hypothetical protein